VKTALVILFSLALMLAGLPVPAAFACVRTAPKSCCHCGGKMACCQPGAAHPAGQNPALPAPRSAQTDFLPALCLAMAVLALPPAAEFQTLSVTSTPPMRAVPLFTRDCAFLI
jgi:hypothetical protein